MIINFYYFCRTQKKSRSSHPHKYLLFSFKFKNIRIRLVADCWLASHWQTAKQTCVNCERRAREKGEIKKN